jgi:hypothetical protein
VKDLWSLYITALDVKFKEKKDKKRDRKDVDEFAETSEEEQTEEEDDVTSATDRSSGSRAFRSDLSILKKYPPLIVSPLVSYLAIVILRLPVTLSDIVGYFLIATLLI